MVVALVEEAAERPNELDDAAERPNALLGPKGELDNGVLDCRKEGAEEAKGEA